MFQREAEGEFISFWKKVGIVAGGALAAIALATTILSFLTGPIYRRMDAEAAVRSTTDSLIFVQSNKIILNQVLLAEYLLETNPHRKRRLLRRIEESHGER